MRLTIQTDYALRTLMYLAAKADRTTIAEVAGLFGISVHHVAKVVYTLARLGYIRSVRGIGGGIELAREPEDILLGDVIQSIEGRTSLLECVDTEDVCSIQSFCKLKSVLGEAERVQMEYLRSVTLLDVTPTKRKLLATHK